MTPFFSIPFPKESMLHLKQGVCQWANTTKLTNIIHLLKLILLSEK